MKIKFAFDLPKEPESLEESKSLKDFSEIKYIIVGDNPGVEEYDENRFFIGSSGTLLRNHFIGEGKNKDIETKIVEDFDKECLIFNKTFLSTVGTEDLEEVKKEIGEQDFNRILLFTSTEIANYSKILNIPILVFGKSKLGKNDIFYPFWENLLKLADNDKIYLFNHPSNGNFSKEWNKYREKEEYKDKSTKELLEIIGRDNFNKHKIK